MGILRKTVYVASDGSEHPSPEAAALQEQLLARNLLLEELASAFGAESPAFIELWETHRQKIHTAVEADKYVSGELLIKRRGRRPGSTNKKKRQAE